MSRYVGATFGTRYPSEKLLNPVQCSLVFYVLNSCMHGVLAERNHTLTQLCRVQALIPSFLEVLAQDYKSWASGATRKTVHLAPTALQDTVKPPV